MENTLVSRKSISNCFANTANGVYFSSDRGDSWKNRIEGLPVRYGTAIAVDPNLMIATKFQDSH